MRWPSETSQKKLSNFFFHFVQLYINDIFFSFSGSFEKCDSLKCIQELYFNYNRPHHHHSLCFKLKKNTTAPINMFLKIFFLNFFYWESFLGCIFKPTDLSNNIKKVWSRSQTATFSLNVGHQFWRQNFNHGFWGQFVHGVILMVTPWKITELCPSEFVDPLDDLYKKFVKSI